MADRMYGAGWAAALKAGLDLDTDTIKMALLTSTYTFSAAHDNYDDLTNEVTGSTGYTAGGATLASVTVTHTAADSWGTTWATGTAYTAGQVVRPTAGNGYLYVANAAGTSHGVTEPTWPTTIGDTVTDNDMEWYCAGTQIVVFDAADPSWAGSTITARYGVVYKDTGVDSTSSLLALKDFGGNISSTGAAFTVTLSSLGWAYVIME